MAAALALEWDQTEIEWTLTVSEAASRLETKTILKYSDILAIVDAYEPMALEVDEMAQIDVDHSAKAKRFDFGFSEAMMVLILAGLASGFLYLNSSINDTRKELQEALTIKASEELVLQMSRQADESRRHFDAQFKSVQAQIKSDGDLTRDKLEGIQRTIGRLEAAN